MLTAFIAGVVMTMLGLTLLIQGEVRLGRRKIKKGSARRLGIFLLAFFPLIVIERFLLNRFDQEEEIDRMLVHGCVTGFWVIAGAVMLMLALRRPARRPASAESNIGRSNVQAPVESFEASAEPPAVKPSRTPHPGERSRTQKKPTPPRAGNPFDFE